MTIEDTAGTVVRWWRGHRLLTLGLAAVATVLAFVVGFALIPHPETFRTAPDLIARLDELGAPCVDYVSQSQDETWGLCKAHGRSFLVVTDASAAARNLPEWPKELGRAPGKAVAAGDGWYVFGDAAYVTRVADLLDADLIS